MKYLKRFLPVFLLFMTVFIGSKADAKASALNENISVTVSMNSEVVFEPDGTPFCDEFIVKNNSNVGIEIESVNITEYNGWQLVTSDTKIKTDAKQFSYQFDDQDMLGGRNELHLEIKESESVIFWTEINYGVWTYSSPFEKALEIEVEYEIEKQMRTLTLDGAGYGSDSTLQVLESTEVTLPTLPKNRYQFMGWADSNGKRYTDTFTMPCEDTTLTALWKLPVYAIYTKNDYTLTFVQSETVIRAGQTHNGKRITTVYSGFDEQEFSSPDDVPWFSDGTWEYIDIVVFEDPVFPKSTAYWFFQHYYCYSFDVAKLYTHRVQDMTHMFYLAGGYRQDMGLVITGLENWDTSQVTSMWAMFGCAGIYAPSVNIGNIGVWDMSNVQDIHDMFDSLGMRATEVYVGDLGMWKTNSLENMQSLFCNMGSETTHLDIGNIGNWDVSRVTSFYSVFEGMGQYSESVHIGDLSQWDVGNSEDFMYTFQNTAAYAKDFYVGDLSQWNLSKAQSTMYMFSGAGRYSETFYLGDISKWNVEEVGNMNGMFAYAGSLAEWQLDLTTWDASDVSYHANFASGVEDKITEPIWLN